MKKIRNLFAIGSILSAVVSYAQISGSGTYLKGNYVEIGIDNLGGFEGANCLTAPVPSGMHLRSANNLFGFTANPQMNGWAGSSFDGDFFTPGSPENGWGFEIADTGGISLGNNCSYLQQIAGAVTSWSYLTPQTICEWEGDALSGTNLHVKINYELHDNDLFYITTVFITNNTGAPISDLRYYRNLDPDNNQEIGGSFTTENTIISQITMGGANTRVSASQTTPWSSYFEFLAVDSNWVAGYGGFANRDASDMYNGIGYTQSVGSVNLADEAIYLAYEIPLLAPGGTQSFKFCSVFDPTAVTAATTALNLSTVSVNEFANSASPVSVYPNPFNNEATITIDKSVQLKNTKLQVYDVLGKEVAAVSNIQDHQFKFEKGNLIPGLYFYKIINDEQEIASGKILIN
ncbi:MAG: T9SS type A sorting domain-containing protein [Bacteroidetes bacterium]|nr:T9SS type A sorting domain-containing protein [Bacteroidota bacterium]